jgi:hypothetical protein
MRPWLIASCSLMVVLLFALSWTAVENLAAINPNNGGKVWLGFISGLVVGGAIGFIAIKLAHGLVMAVMGYRNERLLLRYYDAFQATARGEINTPPVSGDEGVP